MLGIFTLWEVLSPCFSWSLHALQLSSCSFQVVCSVGLLLTCLLHWLWANPTGTTPCEEKFHLCKPVTGVWMWLCAHLWINFMNLGKDMQLNLQLGSSLTLLGSHERLQEIKGRNYQGFVFSCCCISADWPSFILLKKLFYCKVSLCVAQPGHCQERGRTQSSPDNPDEIRNSNELWPCGRILNLLNKLL